MKRLCNNIFQCEGYITSKNILFKNFLLTKRLTSIEDKLSKKIQFRLLLLTVFFICTSVITRAQDSIIVNTSAGSLMNVTLKQFLQSGKVKSELVNNTPRTFQVAVYGRIKRVSSPEFTITTIKTLLTFTLLKNSTKNLDTKEILAAFGGLNSGQLIIDPEEVTNIDPTNIILPDGLYEICFFVNKGCDPTPNPECDLSNYEDGCGSFTVTTCSQPSNGVTITTTSPPQLNPYIAQDFSNSGVKSSARFTNPQGCIAQVKLFGKIERITPTPFTIELNPEFSQQSPLTLTTGITPISAEQLRGALNNLVLDETNLLISGIDLNLIRDANNNLWLPDGNYKICYYARYFKGNILGETASDPASGCANFAINCSPPNGVQITTIAKPQINAIISQAISGGAISTQLQINNQPLCNTQVKVFGRIERLSPSSFSIAVKPDYTGQQPILLNPGSVTTLSVTQQQQAFGNFQQDNLVVEGIDPSLLTDAAGNIKLPDGNYRICYNARYINLDGTLAGEASNPALGCGSFTLCNQAGGAPQFTQPINNLDITTDVAIVNPASPVIFSWTPPQSNCGLPPGGFTYDFEIRELFSGQTVTDALYNPYVFQKKTLPSTTFLLDTNLYKNVLQTGKRYAIRVRAISVNTATPAEIDNDGYSRVEAFQYGGNLISQQNFYEPQDYYIDYGQRKCAYWNDVLTKFKDHQRGDTLMPLKEYIAFALTQDNIGYSTDAIELFLTLNPELAEVKKVKLSYVPRLPVWPAISETDKAAFAKDLQNNLEPDIAGASRFSKYLDTLNSSRQKIPDKAVGLINDLKLYLNDLKTGIDSVDRTTLEYLNNLMAELLYELRHSTAGMSAGQYTHLQKIAATLKDLTAEEPNSTDYGQLFPLRKQSSLAFYVDRVDNGHAPDNTGVTDKLLAAIMKQLKPYDIVVYRNAKQQPFKPVLDAPDLMATFRIFYTLSDLFNARNPAVNAKSTSRLASTVQVALPSNTKFTFRTLNMLNHRTTKPVEVDLKDVLNQTNKSGPEAKRLTIVLKVE